MSAFAELMAFQRETAALSQIAGRTGWDMETMMPAGAAEQRGDEMAAMTAVLHARHTDPKVGEWLSAIDASALSEVEQAQVRETARDFERRAKVPVELAKAIAKVTAKAHHEWADARAADDVAAFLPTLTEVISLTREKAAALADGGDLYDALVEDFEPGMTAARLSEMFGAMRPRLVALIDQIKGAPQPPALSGDFPAAAQMALAEKLAMAFGYDMSRGRIDKAVHPFSSGSGNDVRITTRTDPKDPLNCLYSTIHEVGHACYEQTVDPAYGLTPIGQGVSMGVHESQSRIYENQFGRSDAFVEWLFGAMHDAFGSPPASDAKTLHAAVNAVRPGYIRTEADELHYNLHIMLRFDLEHQLISGSLAVEDLEDAWNSRFAADFGVAVDKPSNGCLQDVHWSAGLFGYFPTYSLGNVYAGCLHDAVRRDLPALDENLRRGEFSPVSRWLGDHLQRHGSLYAPADVIARATGAAPSVEPLMAYLDDKFTGLYGL